VIQTNGAGLFLSANQWMQQSDLKMFATQFEFFAARQAFPCFGKRRDEER
jgi:hypothetical protein